MSFWFPATYVLLYKAEHRRGRKRKRMLDEGAADEADISPKDRFKIQTYLVMIDSLLAELKKIE